MTNFESIKNMSIEEMVKFLNDVYVAGWFDGNNDEIESQIYGRKWLESEVDVMTPQEAIEIITNAIQSGNVTAEQDKALAMAQMALKKQIPKKPKICDYGNGTVNFGCPNCKRKIISKIGGDWCGGETSNCCDRCGQALDWGDEK